jgi:hypothetical protein
MAINVGQGTVLKATISSTLTVIAQVTEIDGPAVEVGAKETTNLASTSKTYRAQLPDSGTVSFTIQYDPANTTHTQLTAWANTWPQTLIVWNVLFNTTGGSDTAAFSAFLTKFKPKGMNEEDNLEADVELKLSGLVTWS